jgi:hypothetical protein
MNANIDVDENERIGGQNIITEMPTRFLELVQHKGKNFVFARNFQKICSLSKQLGLFEAVKLLLELTKPLE